MNSTTLQGRFPYNKTQRVAFASCPGEAGADDAIKAVAEPGHAKGSGNPVYPQLPGCANHQLVFTKSAAHKPSSHKELL